MKTLNIFSIIFQRNYDQYEGVYNFKIYLIRLVFLLTFVFVGMSSWTTLLTFEGSWDPVRAVAFCVWAAYSTLSVLGVIHPLKMLPILIFQIFYKSIWLIIVAYPLWSSGQLAGSPAEEMTYTFLWIVLPLIAMPWGYFVKTYVLKSNSDNHKSETMIHHHPSVVE